VPPADTALEATADVGDWEIRDSKDIEEAGLKGLVENRLAGTGPKKRRLTGDEQERKEHFRDKTPASEPNLSTTY